MVLSMRKNISHTISKTNSRSDTAFLFAQNLLKALKGAGSSVHSGLKKEVSSYGRRY